jgi:phosphate:Na+ symporter
VALLSVEAINGGFVTFRQVLAVMLGANIGFTLTVQLLAFKFYVYNAVFLTLGIPVYVFSKRITWRGAGQAVMGIGFLLASIQMLSVAVAPLRDSPEVREIIAVLDKHPVWLMWFAAGLKVVLQSATATIGIALALCAEQVLPINSAVAVVIGANIGIGVTALLAGYPRIETRRMAAGNLLFKLAGAAVCMPLLPQFVALLERFTFHGTTHDTQLIANAHSLFNIALMIVFLPLVPALAALLEKIMPAPPTAETTAGPRYLDRSSLESPALALGQATREILHMADEVQAMLRDAHRALENGNQAICAAVQQRDDVVDTLNNEIKAYITQLSQQALTHEESRREIALLSFAHELESIGDIIDKNLIELAKKRLTLGVSFSKDGWAELDGYFLAVLENFEIAVAAFASQDRALAEKLLRHKQRISERERELRNQHFHRLHAGLAESVETSSIHLDALTYLKHINSLLTTVAYPILEAKPA